MSQPGMMVMVHMLLGNEESVRTLELAIGKTIRKVEVDDAVVFEFNDNTHLYIRDTGQSCCESRFLTCDDDLTPYVGAKLVGATIRELDEPEVSDWDKAHPDQFEYDPEVHDIGFLVVETSVGSFTVCTHVDHNGYYGGFAMECSLEKPDD